MTIQINQEKCIGCNRCVSMCPQKILYLDEDKKCQITDKALCDNLKGCARICPTGAITFD